MKTCPYCVESIQDGALKCRYCGSQLAASLLTREWYRSRRGKKIAGVCAGLAEEFGIAATPIRLAFVLFTLLAGGAGIILYLVLWMVMPYRDEPPTAIAYGERQPLEADRRLTAEREPGPPVS
ncbi:MAG: PspC domain-containing protein [Candidatus Binatia bacterium]